MGKLFIRNAAGIGERTIERSKPRPLSHKARGGRREARSRPQVPQFRTRYDRAHHEHLRHGAGDCASIACQLPHTAQPGRKARYLRAEHAARAGGRHLLA